MTSTALIWPDQRLIFENSRYLSQAANFGAQDFAAGSSIRTLTWAFCILAAQTRRDPQLNRLELYAHFCSVPSTQPQQ